MGSAKDSGSGVRMASARSMMCGNKKLKIQSTGEDYIAMRAGWGGESRRF